MLQSNIDNAIKMYAESFEKTLYEEDSKFLAGMKDCNLAGDAIEKYKFWEWTQGVGLYGFWKLYKKTKDEKYLNILNNYYQRQIKIGLPSKNVNTVTPLLTLSYLAVDQKNEEYLSICKEWAEWIYQSFPRTKERGFQHITSDTVNDQELWDDTLFMTVLFLANMGRILDNKEYQEEAIYQFLIHVKYLFDKKTGLWFHGWTFKGNHNFANGLWGRGNCWITIAIPEFLEIIDCEESIKRYLVETWKAQVDALVKYQNQNGMWHTLVDDATSYVESSATCGFAYGILKGVNQKLLDDSYAQIALKAVRPIMKNTDQDGIVHQVSYGTPMGRESKQFYKDIEIKPMPYGQALAILFFMEVNEYLGKKEKVWKEG